MSRTPNEDEAAAIATAIERFVAETAPGGGEGKDTIGPWQRAALIEGVGAKKTIRDLGGEGGARWQS